MDDFDGNKAIKEWQSRRDAEQLASSAQAAEVNQTYEDALQNRAKKTGVPIEKDLDGIIKNYKAYDEEITKLTIDNPYKLAACEQIHGKVINDVVSCLIKSETNNSNKFSSDEVAIDLAPIITTAVAIVIAIAVIWFVRRRKSLQRRGIRAFISVATAWIFAAGSYAFIFNLGQDMDESRIAALLILPPVGFLLCAILWAWYRKTK